MFQLCTRKPRYVHYTKFINTIWNIIFMVHNLLICLSYMSTIWLFFYETNFPLFPHSAPVDSPFQALALGQEIKQVNVSSWEWLCFLSCDYMRQNSLCTRLAAHSLCRQNCQALDSFSSAFQVPALQTCPGPDMSPLCIFWLMSLLFLAHL